MSFPLSSTGRICIQWGDRNILLLITACSTIGIIVGRFQPPFISATAAVIAAVLLTVGAFILLHLRQQRVALFLSLPLFLLVGYLNILHHLNALYAAGNISTLLQQQSQVTVVGTLESMIEEASVQNDQQKKIISRFEIKVRELLIHNRQTGWQPVNGKMRLSMQGRATDLQPGMTLMILANAGPTTSFKTPGVFDYQGYLAAQNIYVSGGVNSRQDIIIVSDQETAGRLKKIQRMRYLPEQVRHQVSLFLRQHLNPAVSGIYQALLIGSRAGVSLEIQEQFKAVGTMHLLAISGLHMGLLGLMINSIFSWLLKRSSWLLLHTHVPALTLLATLPILFGYGFVAGMNTPVLRALSMAAVLLSATLLRRQYSMIHLVAAAALLVLALHPLSLFTASFQLSFGAVTALALFFPKISTPASSDKTSTSGKMTAFATRLFRYILAAVLVSITATVGTLPFMLLHFHRFSLIGPVMNLLVEPFLCFWALPWGLAAIPCIFIFPQAAVLLLKIGSFGIAAGQYCTAIGSTIPYSSVWTITPTSMEIIVYGLLLLLWHFKSEVQHAKKIVLVGAAMLMLHFTWSLWFPEQPKESKIAYLDIGQGSSAFLHLPDGSRILVDGGGNTKSSLHIGEQVIGPYLWTQRIWKLDQVVISHPHSDHFNGLDFILARFKPKTLFVSGHQHREGNYQQILDQAEQQDVDIIIPESGRKIVQGRAIELEIIGMSGLPGQEKASVNDSSLVLRYRHGTRTFLFPGDISRKNENILLKKEVNLAADVLFAPHHGSITSTSESFLVAVNPQLIVVSAGKYGERYYPAPANFALWKQKNIPVRITRNQGTVTCATDGKKLRCTEFADRFKRL